MEGGEFDPSDLEDLAEIGVEVEKDFLADAIDKGIRAVLVEKGRKREGLISHGLNSATSPTHSGRFANTWLYSDTVDLDGEDVLVTIVGEYGRTPERIKRTRIQIGDEDQFLRIRSTGSEEKRDPEVWERSVDTCRYPQKEELMRYKRAVDGLSS